MHLPGPGFDGNNLWGSWQAPNGYRTIVHEFSHYTIGALDEYRRVDGSSTSCTLSQLVVPEDYRASIMDSQYTSTEYCDDSTHNSDDEQGQVLNELVWATLVRNWSDLQGRWTLRSPMTRGTADPGPYSLPAMDTLSSVVSSPTITACNAIQVVVLYNGAPVQGGLDATIQHSGYTIDDVTANDGSVWVYGAVPGDVFNMSAVDNYTHKTLTARLTIPGPCPTGVLTTTMQASGQPSFSPDFHVDWGATKAAPSLSIVLPFAAEPSAPPAVAVGQDGAARQPVTLSHNSATHVYTGTFAFNPTYAANFAVDVSFAGTRHTFNVVGEQYHSAGPFVDAQGHVDPLPAPAQWVILPGWHGGTRGQRDQYAGWDGGERGRHQSARQPTLRHDRRGRSSGR